jgi:hypothetical protein
MMRHHFYIGIDRLTHKFKAFRYIKTPTEANCGDLFAAVIGPFKTKRAALWAEQYGQNNPHFRHVDDAERLCRL